MKLLNDIYKKKYEILYLKGLINYTEIHGSNNELIISSYSLHIVQANLNHRCFLRVNKSFVINSTRIKDIRYEANRLFVVLTNDKEFAVSRRRVKEFETAMNLQKEYGVLS